MSRAPNRLYNSILSIVARSTASIALQATHTWTSTKLSRKKTMSKAAFSRDASTLSRKLDRAFLEWWRIREGFSLHHALSSILSTTETRSLCKSSMLCRIQSNRVLPSIQATTFIQIAMRKLSSRRYINDNSWGISQNIIASVLAKSRAECSIIYSWDSTCGLGTLGHRLSWRKSQTKST